MKHKVEVMLGLVAVLALAATANAQPQPVAETERLDRTLAALEPQRRGVVDAYVVVAALDTDPVFGREAREAGRVLAKRFGAEGRTVVLAQDEGADRADAAGTPQHLTQALARVAALMDRDEDALVLYTTSHGTPSAGLNFKTIGAAGIIKPAQLAAMLDQHRFQNRLIILQACYSGQFIPLLSTPGTVIATAASTLTPSFGCHPGNDWTFFGDALVNRAMRQPDSFARQFRRAFVTIDGWERKLGIAPSNPQISIGKETRAWLSALDAHAPKAAGAPVGRSPAESGQ